MVIAYGHSIFSVRPAVAYAQHDFRILIAYAQQFLGYSLHKVRILIAYVQHVHNILVSMCLPCAQHIPNIFKASHKWQKTTSPFSIGTQDDESRP